jgi:hypothetical protein
MIILETWIATASSRAKSARGRPERSNSVTLDFPRVAVTVRPFLPSLNENDGSGSFCLRSKVGFARPRAPRSVQPATATSSRECVP